MIYLIYSREHNAWWRPARRGYTGHIAEAGRYSAQEAYQIAYDANRYQRPDEALPHGGPKEVVVPAPEQVGAAMDGTPPEVDAL